MEVCLSGIMFSTMMFNLSYSMGGLIGAVGYHIHTYVLLCLSNIMSSSVIFISRRCVFSGIPSSAVVFLIATAGVMMVLVVALLMIEKVACFKHCEFLSCLDSASPGIFLNI